MRVTKLVNISSSCVVAAAPAPSTPGLSAYPLALYVAGGITLICLCCVICCFFVCRRARAEEEAAERAAALAAKEAALAAELALQALKPAPLVRVTDILQLTHFGVAPTALQQRHVSLDSASHVAVRDESTKQIVIAPIDTRESATVVANTDNAIEAAIVHPLGLLVALRLGARFVVRDLQTQQDVAAVTMSAESVIVWWGWLDEETVALVSERAVFHWMFCTSAQPAQIFERVAHESEVQVVSYCASHDRKFLLLGGVMLSAEGGAHGHLLLQFLSHRSPFSHVALRIQVRCNFTLWISAEANRF